MVRRILAPIDGSPAARAGLLEALALAAASCCELHLLHLIDDMPVLRVRSARREPDQRSST